MAFDLIAFSALALVLGAKHAFDADHVVAIGNILTRQTRWERTVALSSSWGVGHMVTAGLVSALLYFFADTFVPSLTGHMEFLVPFLLVVVGALGLAAVFRRFHYHRHAHEAKGKKHGHFHLHLKEHHQHGAMAGIGVVHGLASNDELLVVLLVGLGADAWWQVGLGVVLFSLGVMVSMALYATLIHATTQRTKITWIPDAATALFSVVSIVYAVYLFAGGSGLNLVQRFWG